MRIFLGGIARDWGLLALRIAVGLVFIAHGYPKLFPSGPGGFAGFLASLGIPAPMFFAWVVTIVELFGGIAMILGLLVPLFGIGMVIDMIVAITKVRAPRVGFTGQQPGWEFEFLLAGAALALALAGAGRLSLDAMLTSRRTKS